MTQSTKIWYTVVDSTEMMSILYFIGWSMALSFILLILSLIISSRNPYFEKTTTYECGFEPFEDARNKFSVKFYVVAILFIIFDIEILFFLPWLINISYIKFWGFWGMIIFLIILTIGFLYEMLKGALDWEGQQRQDSNIVDFNFWSHMCILPIMVINISGVQNLFIEDIISLSLFLPAISNKKNFSLQLKVFLGKYIEKNLPSSKIFLSRDELILKINPKFIYDCFYFLKYHTGTRLDNVNDLCIVDYPDKKNRFELIYNFQSIFKNYRLTIITQVRERVPVWSLTNLYEGINWLEREAWDLFGVFFINHKDLRRILTDYGFKGHPLRKDFPLTGFSELRYNDFDGKINYEPVALAQEYRIFNYTN